MSEDGTDRPDAWARRSCPECNDLGFKRLGALHENKFVSCTVCKGSPLYLTPVAERAKPPLTAFGQSWSIVSLGSSSEAAVVRAPGIDAAFIEEWEDAWLERRDEWSTGA